MPRSPFPELPFRIAERGRRGTVAGSWMGCEWGRRTNMNRIRKREGDGVPAGGRRDGRPGVNLNAVLISYTNGVISRTVFGRRRRELRAGRWREAREAVRRLQGAARDGDPGGVRAVASVGGHAYGAGGQGEAHIVPNIPGSRSSFHSYVPGTSFQLIRDHDPNFEPNVPKRYTPLRTGNLKLSIHVPRSSYLRELL